MSDMAEEGLRPGIEDLARRIQEAPAKLWSRVRSALGTKTRDEAVALVQEDLQAAQVAQAILSKAPAEVAPSATTPEGLPGTRAGGKAKLKIG